MFRSASGGPLKGVYYDALVEPERGIVVACHPATPKGQAWFHRAAILPRLRRAGWSVFTFDFNGWGESPDSHLDQSLDVLGALRFMRSFPDADALPLAVIGFSMGAGYAVAALPSVDEEDVQAAVFDGPWTTISDLWPERRGVMAAFHVATLGRSWRRQPLARARRLPAFPKLFTTGERDEETPPDMVRRLYDRASEPKELWVAPGLGHLEGALRGAPAYVERVLGVLDRAAAPRSPSAAGTEQ